MSYKFLYFSRNRKNGLKRKFDLAITVFHNKNNNQLFINFLIPLTACIILWLPQPLYPGLDQHYSFFCTSRRKGVIVSKITIYFAVICWVFYSVYMITNNDNKSKSLTANSQYFDLFRMGSSIYILTFLNFRW